MNHTLEILVMLGVALLLGALLYHFATSHRRRLLRAAQAEVVRLQSVEASLTQRLAQTEKELEQTRNDLAAAATRLARLPEAGGAPALADTLATLRAQQAALADQLAGVRHEVDRLLPPAA